jgi:hypothetical protein
MLVVVLDAKLAAPFSHPAIDYCYSKYISCNIQKASSLKQDEHPKKPIKLCMFGKQYASYF